MDDPSLSTEIFLFIFIVYIHRHKCDIFTVYSIINCFVYVHDHRLSHLSPDVHIIGHLNREQYVCLCTKWIEHVMKQSVYFFWLHRGSPEVKSAL